jgi:hypothetical protein
MTTLTLDRTGEVLAVVTEYFEPCGYWLHPKSDRPALVRVQVAGGRYVVHRRRKPHTAWVPLVDADVAEFDADSFRTWVANWPLVA